MFLSFTHHAYEGHLLLHINEGEVGAVAFADAIKIFDAKDEGVVGVAFELDVLVFLKIDFFSINQQKESGFWIR